MANRPHSEAERLWRIWQARRPLYVWKALTFASLLGCAGLGVFGYCSPKTPQPQGSVDAVVEERYKAEIQKKQNDLDAAYGKITELEQRAKEYGKRTQENSQLKGQNQQYQAALQAKEKELAQSNSQIRTLQEQVGKTESERIASLTQQHEADKRDWGVRMAAVARNASDFEKKLGACGQQFADYKKTSEQKLTEANSQLTETNTRLANANARISELQKELQGRPSRPASVQTTPEGFELDADGYVVFPNRVGIEIDRVEMERFGLDLGVLFDRCRFMYCPETKKYTQKLWWQGAEAIWGQYPAERIQQIYEKIKGSG
jgi:hypothetical protein